MKKIAFLSLCLLFSFLANAQNDLLKQVVKQTAMQAAMSYAQSNPKLSKFATLLQTAQTFGLLGKNNANPLTFLAPSNDAFDAMPKGAFEKLLTNKKGLTTLLNNHVLATPVQSTGLNNTLKNMSGKALDVKQEGENTLINGAKVVEKDIKTDSGTLLHIIDKVLN